MSRRLNRTTLLVGAAVVVPLLLLLAVSFRFDPRAIDTPLLERQAPPFVLADLDGAVYNLEDLRGKPVLINFWGTYCQPCIVEHPLLLALSRRYEGQVHFLGIIYQEPDLEDVRRFVAARGAWGPSLVDDGGRVAIAYGVYGAPETFILDRDGMIVERIAGMIPAQSAVKTLDGLL